MRLLDRLIQIAVEAIPSMKPIRAISALIRIRFIKSLDAEPFKKFRPTFQRASKRQVLENNSRESTKGSCDPLVFDQLVTAC